MSDFISLSCPKCGGKLKITKDMEQFVCLHCGTEHLVKLTEGAISLMPLTKELRRISTGTDQTAAELALIRLKNDLEEVDRLLRQHVNAEMAHSCLRKMGKIKRFGTYTYLEYFKELEQCTFEDMENCISDYSELGDRTKTKVLWLTTYLELRKRKGKIMTQMFQKRKLLEGI